MLGEAKKESVGFHGQKLHCMSLIAQHSLSVLTDETGEMDYRPKDALLGDKWKEMFDEDLPLVSLLTVSANQIAEDAEKFSMQ